MFLARTIQHSFVLGLSPSYWTKVSRPAYELPLSSKVVKVLLLLRDFLLLVIWSWLFGGPWTLASQTIACSRLLVPWDILASYMLPSSPSPICLASHHLCTWVFRILRSIHLCPLHTCTLRLKVPRLIHFGRAVLFTLALVSIHSVQFMPLWLILRLGVMLQAPFFCCRVVSPSHLLYWQIGFGRSWSPPGFPATSRAIVFHRGCYCRCSKRSTGPSDSVHGPWSSNADQLYIRTPLDALAALSKKLVWGKYFAAWNAFGAYLWLLWH